MKLKPHIPPSTQSASWRPRGAFTLPEMLVAITLLILLIGGIVSAHLFGLSMFRITETKLSATDDARKAIDRMVDEIHTCRNNWIGDVKLGEFVALLDGEKQQGTALMICPSTNTAEYIIYFVNPADQTFRRTTSARKSATILADSVTSKTLFRGLDFRGNVLTNNQNNRVINVNLDFYQPSYFSQVADHYRLETSATRRVLE